MVRNIRRKATPSIIARTNEIVQIKKTRLELRARLQQACAEYEKDPLLFAELKKYAPDIKHLTI